METALVIAVGIGFLVTVVSLLIMMFALFFIARDMGDSKRVAEQNFVQTQLNNARLMSMERQLMYIHEVIRREEQAQALLNNAAASLGGAFPPPAVGGQGMFPPGVSFQNEDGSIKAGSFEDLLDKMQKDPRYGKPKNKELDFLDGLFKNKEEDDEEDES